MQAGADVDRFSRGRWRRGYDVDEVDALIERIEATVAGRPHAEPVTVEEVRAAQFTVVRGGYATDEVAMFLEHVVRQLPSAPPAAAEPARPAEPPKGYAEPLADPSSPREVRFPGGLADDEPFETVQPVAFPGGVVDDDGWNGHALGIPLPEPVADPAPAVEERPATDAVPERPVEQAPVAQAPVAQAPVAQAPVAQAPVEQPSVEQPSVEQPARTPPDLEPIEQPIDDATDASDASDGGMNADDGAHLLAALAFATVVLGQPGARFERRPERALGYNVANVDDFVDHVGATLNSTLTVGEVRMAVFGSQRGGYDDAAVDAWLEQVVDRVVARS